MDGVANKEDYDQYGDPMREDDADVDETYVKRRMKSHDHGLDYSTTNKRGKTISLKRRRRQADKLIHNFCVCLFCIPPLAAKWCNIYYTNYYPEGNSGIAQTTDQIKPLSLWNMKKNKKNKNKKRLAWGKKFIYAQ